MAPESGATGTALVGGPFALVDQAGNQVTEQDFAGRFMLVYFGYTWCPDFCPMSLTTMVQALDLLAPEQAAQVVPVLITVDPGRDTVEQLAEYVPLFHPRLVGLTGTPEQTAAAARAYRVYFNKVEEGDPDAYLMDHSTFIYLMGPEGEYRRHFGASATPEEVAEGLRAELARG
jgi:protein SCO1/2